MPAYYPVFLDVRNRNCVIFGGGTIGQEKVERLITSGANIHVVNPNLTDATRTLAQEGKIKWSRRRYQPGDLRDAFIAIVADTSDASVNQLIFEEASRNNVPLNVADITHLCTWITPAVVQRGEVIIAASTGGSSPALARRFREELSGTNRVKTKLGVMEYADLAPLLSEVRSIIRDKGININPDHWQVCLTDNLVEMVQTKQYQKAKTQLLQRLMEGTTCGCQNGVCRQWEELGIDSDANQPTPHPT